jgi:hypothetical protein
LVSPNLSTSYDFEASQLTTKSKLNSVKSGLAFLEQPTLVASKRPFQALLGNHYKEGA